MKVLRRLLDRRDGNIAVEVALAAPVLLIMLAGLADVGRAVLADSRLKSAIRAGLEYAQANSGDTAGIAAVAQHRNIQLRSVKATLEAGMDLQGILGIDSDVRNGFDAIKVTFKVDADATQDEIRALVAQSQKRSAVFDIVTNPTNVTVEVN